MILPISNHRHQGFTLVEVLVAIAIVGVLAAVALPSYSDYVNRSRIPEALNVLASHRTLLEQRHQDTNSYQGSGTACSMTPPSTIAYFTISCVATSAQAFVVTATGTGQMSGYRYTIDQDGTRVTAAHPKFPSGTTSMNCWTTKGSACE